MQKYNSNLNHAFINIEEDKNFIEDKLHSLIFSNYKIFLENYQKEIDVKEKLKELEQIVQINVNTLDELKKDIPVAHQSIVDINEKHQKIKLALNKYPKLVELLEIPQLMDTCLKNSLYEPSLQLYNYVKKLTLNYPKIDVFKLIEKECEKDFEGLIKGLVLKLENESNLLPELIKTIGLIRSVGVFGETKLRHIFLRSKSRHLRFAIKTFCVKLIEQEFQLGDLNASKMTNIINYLFINQVCDLFRINIFEALTQYSALFSLNEELSTTTTTSGYEFNSDNSSTISRPELYNRILHSWLSFELDNMIEVLDHYLGILFDPVKQDAFFDSEIAIAFVSLYDQFNYVGMSLSRLNLNLRSLLLQKLLDHVTCFIPSMFGRLIEKFKSNLFHRYNYYCRLQISPTPKKHEPIRNIENSTKSVPIIEPSIIIKENPLDAIPLQSDKDELQVSEVIKEQAVHILNQESDIYKPNVIIAAVQEEDPIPLLSALRQDLFKCLENASLSIPLNQENIKQLEPAKAKIFAFTYPICLKQYSQTLIECAKLIQQFYEECPGHEKRALISYEKLMKHYVEYFVPDLIRIFMKIFPKSQLENAIGITALKSYRMFDGMEELTRKIIEEIPKLK